jgi:hypothetical protein
LAKTTPARSFQPTGVENEHISNPGVDLSMTIDIVISVHPKSLPGLKNYLKLKPRFFVATLSGLEIDFALHFVAVYYQEHKFQKFLTNTDYATCPHGLVRGSPAPDKIYSFRS